MVKPGEFDHVSDVRGRENLVAQLVCGPWENATTARKSPMPLLFVLDLVLTLFSCLQVNNKIIKISLQFVIQTVYYLKALGHYIRADYR